MRSFLTPGRKLKKGTIVAACSVLTKDFDEYTVVGGNPAHFIKSQNYKYLSSFQWILEISLGND